MELSADDLELVHALQIAPRISWADAGIVLGKHPTTLAARWQRLRQSGQAWVTGHLLDAPGSNTVSFHDVDCEPERRAAVIRALCSVPEVISVEESARNRDLVLTVLTPSWAALTRVILPQLMSIPGLRKIQTSVATTVHSVGNSWRLDVLSPQQQSEVRTAAPLSAPSGERLPTAYWPIVRLLAQDGRASAVEIAEATGQHPSSARRQLNRVLASRTVSFRCELAQDYSGFPISCQWFATVPPREQLLAAAHLARYRNLRLCASTTGTSNFTFVLWLRSATEIGEIEATFLDAVPSARIDESAVTINFIKRVGWMLNPDGTATGEVVLPRAPDSVSTT